MIKTDYSKLLEENFRHFALKLNDEVKETFEVAFSEDEPDPHSLAKVLARVPVAYAFLTTQYRLIKSIYIKACSEYDAEYDKSFAEAVEECGSKATAKIINAKVMQLYGNGLSKLKERRDDLEQKTKLAGDMLTVFDRSINALQSLGKLIGAEGFFGSRSK